MVWGFWFNIIMNKKEVKEKIVLMDYYVFTIEELLKEKNINKDVNHYFYLLKSNIKELKENL